MNTRASAALETPVFASVFESRGWIVDGDRFSTGRPDRQTIPLRTSSGMRAIAKIYPAGEGAACWANLGEVWCSSFGERRSPPGLPRPIEYVPSVDAVVVERLPGRVLAELGEPDAAAVERAIGLAADLHGSDARPRRRRSRRGLLRSLRRKVDRMARLDVGLGEQAKRVVDALEARRGDDGELVPCHGDFSPRNVLETPGRSVLIDWDRFQLADPARDVAYFGTWCWVDRLRRGSPALWSVLESAAAAYEGLRPRAPLTRALDFHVSAGLVRIAEGLLTLWGDDAAIAPVLLAEAQARARSAP